MNTKTYKVKVQTVEHLVLTGKKPDIYTILGNYIAKGYELVKQPTQQRINENLYEAKVSRNAIESETRLTVLENEEEML